jgi:hypothetical protein
MFVCIKTVPCFVRSLFNNLVGNVCYAVAMNEMQDKFNVKKRNTGTRICGSGYEIFIKIMT